MVFCKLLEIEEKMVLLRPIKIYITAQGASIIFAQLESFIANQSFAIPPVFKMFLTPSFRGFPAKSNLECFDSNFVFTMSSIS